MIFEDCCTLKPADVECCIFDPRKMAIFSSVQKNPGHKYIFPISAAFPSSKREITFVALKLARSLTREGCELVFAIFLLIVNPLLLLLFILLILHLGNE